MPYGIDDTDRWTRYAPKIEPTKSAPREVIEGVGYYEPIEVHTSLPILPEPTARDRAEAPSPRKNFAFLPQPPHWDLPARAYPTCCSVVRLPKHAGQ